MWRAALTISALAVAAACGGGDIPTGFTTFDGPDPALPTGDLAPLWELTGDARIVALGESIHTSGGFYAMKHRLIRALIEERGVRVIAFETPRDRARKLDAYLTSGVCDRPAAEVFGISVFEVFVDDNTYALMRWICERNAATPGDPVHLFGVDIQQSDEDGAEIEGFLRTWAPADAPALVAGIATCVQLYRDVYTEADHDACLAGIAVLEPWIEAHRAELVAAAGERTEKLFELAEMGFHAEQNHFFLVTRDLAESYEPRDRAMAEVFQRVLALDYPPDVRVALWAHNLHIARNHDRIQASVYVPPRTTTLGTVLGQVYGDDYAPVALTAYAPGTNWPQVDLVTDHTDLGTDPGSVEARCHRVGEPYLIVDPSAPSLYPTHALELNEEVSVPGETYAAIVYLDNSPPMDAVFW